MKDIALKCAILLVFLSTMCWAQEKSGKKSTKDVKLMDIMTSLGSKGHPKIKQLIFEVGDDISEMLEKLDKIMESGSTEENKTVEAWKDAQIYDEWNTKVGEAHAISKEVEKAKGFGFSSWPSDLKLWQKNAHTFLQDISTKGLEAITWKRETDYKISTMVKGLEWDPKKFKEVHKELEWASQQIEDSKEKLRGATTLAQVQAELKRFIRIWKVVNNMQIKLEKRKKEVEKWLQEHTPQEQKKGLTKLAAWRDQVVGNVWLGTCYKAVENWTRLCNESWKSYEKKYDEIKKMNAPILEETLAKDIDGFKNANGFAGLRAEIEKFEKELHAREDMLKK